MDNADASRRATTVCRINYINSGDTCIYNSIRDTGLHRFIHQS